MGFNKRILTLGFIGLLATSLFSQNTPQSVLDSLNNTGDLGAAELSDISQSSNTEQGHRAQMLFDGSHSTWYSSDNSSQAAWVTLDFTESVYLEALEIDGTIPTGTYLYLQTEIEGETLTLPASYLTEGSTSVDLSRERLVVDNLTLRIEGDDFTHLQINEISLKTRSSEGDLQKKKLTPANMDISKKELNHDYLLVDGKIGTTWHNQDKGFGSLVRWFFKGDISEKYHGYSDWKLTDEIILNTDPAEMEFLKFYLTNEACGVLDLEVLVGDNWESLGTYQLSELTGWQKVSLEGLGEISAVKLFMDDPSQQWQEGNYGGMGEVELWSRNSPDRTELKDLISPSYPFSTTEALFDLDDLDEKAYVIQAVTTELTAEPEIYLNGFRISEGEPLTYESSQVWDFSLSDHLLKELGNSLKIVTEEGSQLFSAHLLVSSRDNLQLSDSTLSDGRRHSGRSLISESALLDLIEGEAQIEEIILFFDDVAPGNFYLRNNGLDQYLSFIENGDGEKVFTGAELADQMGVHSLMDIQEIEIQGSRNEILTPSIELLFPLDNIELPQYTTHSYKVIGITDYPQGEITVNGVTASVMENYFWVEMRDLDINDPGSYEIEAKVVHENGNQSTHSALIHIESDSNGIDLDQEDILYVTTESTFTLSGKITGKETDLRVNGAQISVPNNGKFNSAVPLDLGLNILAIELMADDGVTVLKRETRQVYRQDLDVHLSITTPLEGSYTNKDSIPVTGKVSPWGLSGVWINGLEAVVKGDSFSLASVPLASETNTISVTATYETGLTAEETITVNKDQIAPVLSQIQPEPNTPIGTETVIVSGKVQEANGVTVFINGIIATLSGDNFYADVPLPLAGNNLIYVSAQDDAGNTTEWPVFNLFKDRFGPEAFEVEIDPSGYTNNTRPTISFETVDTGIGLSHYEVSVDEGNFYTQESPFKLPNLSHGDIEIIVRAYDYFGNTTDSSVTAQIDIEAPNEVDNFRVVPGNERVLIRWDEYDSQNWSYILGQVGAETTYTVPKGDAINYEEGILSFEQSFEGLTVETEYTFYIQAVDHVGNVGEKVYETAITSETSVSIESNGMSELEYDGLTLYIPQSALPEIVDQIIMREIEDEIILEQSTNPVISPIYSFSVSNNEYGEEEHFTFDKPFVGQITYDEVNLPEGFSEYNLAVFYYDEDWSRWFRTDENRINPETNTITFATDHFSEFTVQPSVTDTLNSSDWDTMQYPGSASGTSHSSFSVSPQSGAASTAMTEFVLPGMNGMDLAIRRTYSSSLSDADSTLLPLNSMGIDYTEVIRNSDDDDDDDDDDDVTRIYYDRTAEEALLDYLSDPSSLIDSWYGSRLKSIYYGRSEYTYALGQGWRLDMPYVRFSDTFVNIYLPELGFINTEELERNENSGNITFIDSLQGRCLVNLRKTSAGGSDGTNRYKISNIEVTTSDGNVYSFHDTGLIDKITDLYGNSINYNYNEDLRINRIDDTKGRGVFFTYYDETEYANFLPVIKNIAVFDSESIPETTDNQINETDLDNSELVVSYEYDIDEVGSVGLPLLLGATDVQGRSWDYSYDRLFLSTKYTGDDFDGDSFYPDQTKSQYIYPLTHISGPGIGFEKVIYGKGWNSNFTENDMYNAELSATFRNIGEEESLVHKTETLAVDKIITYGEEGFSGEEMKTVDYSYKINDEGWISKTTVDDTKSRVVYTYGQKTFKVDQPNSFAAWDLLEWFERDNIEKFEKEIPTGKTTYVYQDSELSFVNSSSYSYYTYQKLKSSVYTKFNLDESNSRKTNYTYDSWGNPTEISISDVTEDTVQTQTMYNWYSSGSSSTLPADISISETPLQTVTSESPTPYGYLGYIDSSIKNRLMRSYITTETSGDIENTEWDEEKIYQYNAMGSLLAKAELIGTEESEEWSINEYAYNENGELIQTISPLGHTTSIDHDYTNSEYDLVTVTKNSVLDEEENLVNRTSYLWKNKVTGWITKEIRADGEDIIYERDKLGRIVKHTIPMEEHETEAPFVEINYSDADGFTSGDELKVTQTDILGNYQELSFNNRGEIVSVKKFNSNNDLLQGALVEQDYFGNVAALEILDIDSQVGIESSRVDYSYDGLGRLISGGYTEQDQDLTFSKEYYQANKTMVHTDEKENQKRFYYDNRNRVIRVETLSSKNYVLSSVEMYYNIRGNLLAQKDGNGNWTYYSYNRQGRLIETVSPSAEFMNDGETSETSELISRRTYNEIGQVKTLTLEMSDGTIVGEKTYNYDNMGRLISETVPYTDGNEEVEATVAYRYDELDRLVRTIDPIGQKLDREYTLRGQLASEISYIDINGDPDNLATVKTTYDYDLLDRIETITDARANSGDYGDYDGTLQFIYDDLNRIEQQILPTRAGEESRIISFNYNDKGNLESRVEPDGGATVYTYTEQNRVKTVTAQDELESPEISYTTEYNYDELGNVVEVVLPGNISEEFDYDEFNRKVKDIRPDEGTNYYSYDKNHNLVKTINGRGFEQYYNYDNLNRLTDYTDASRETWEINYNAQGMVTRTEDPNEVVRRALYDERGAIIKEIDGQGLESTYNYDELGRLEYKIDPRGTTIGFDYREDSLPTEINYENLTEGLTHLVSYDYDEVGSVISAFDQGASSEIIRNYYNQDGQGTYVPDPMGQITRQVVEGYSDVIYSYDEKDRLTGLTNGNYSTIEYNYNSLNQLTAIEDYGLTISVGDDVSYMDNITYNERGFLEGYTLGNGLEMSREYDDRGRLTNLDYTIDGESIKNYTYAYDTTDNMVKENNNLYIYDGKNQLAAAILSDEVVKAEESPVDLNEYGNTDYFSITENDVVGTNKLEETEITEEFTLDWAANSVGVDMGYPYYVNKIDLHTTGDTSRITEETIALYTSVSNRSENYEKATIKSLTEADGIITIELEEPIVARYIKVNSLYNQRSEEYTAIDDSTLGLDTDNPLTVYRLEGGGRNEYYLYDEKGNRAKKTIVVEGEMDMSEYTYYEGSDWLKTDENYGFKYDLNGNLVEKGDTYSDNGSSIDRDSLTIEQTGIYWKYSYDLRNRLIKVEKWDTEENELTTAATYIYDVNGYRIEKENGAGEISNYVFDIFGNMIEEVERGESTRYVFMGKTHIAQIDSDGSRNFFGTNHLGSTTLLTDEDGEVTLTDETTPFGDQENKDMFYTGKKWDEDAQLYYFNARWYDPETARFITEDPIKDGSLWFAYVGNNPMGFVDFTGLDSVEVESGDTLSEIVDDYNEEHGTDYSWEEISEINDQLESAHDIYPGDEINFPDQDPVSDDIGDVVDPPSSGGTDSEPESGEPEEDGGSDDPDQVQTDIISFFGDGIGIEASLMAGRYGKELQGGQATTDWFTIYMVNKSTGEEFSAKFSSYTIDSKGFAVNLGANTISIEGYMRIPSGTSPIETAKLLTGEIEGTQFSALFFGMGTFDSKDGTVHYEVGTFGLGAGVPFSYVTGVKSTTVMVRGSLKTLPGGLVEEHYRNKKEWMSRP